MLQKTTSKTYLIYIKNKKIETEQRVGIVQKVIQEIKLEPVYQEGKLVTLETLSQELRLYKARSRC